MHWWATGSVRPARSTPSAGLKSALALLATLCVLVQLVVWAPDLLARTPDRPRPPVAPPGPGPVDRPLPASVTKNHGLPAGERPPVVPPGVPAAGAPHKLSAEQWARSASAGRGRTTSGSLRRPAVRRPSPCALRTVRRLCTRVSRTAPMPAAGRALDAQRGRRWLASDHPGPDQLLVRSDRSVDFGTQCAGPGYDGGLHRPTPAPTDPRSVSIPILTRRAASAASRSAHSGGMCSAISACNG
jgi:hypothetical protein